MRGTSGSRQSLRAALALVSALALVMGMTGNSVVVSAQSVPQKISYELDVIFGLDGPLCVGESTGFLTGIIRGTTVNGRTYAQWISGGRILGEIEDTHVGEFTHYEVVDVSGAPTPSARFTFLAKAPGSTNLEFTIFKTGEESRVGRDPAFYSYHFLTNIEVVNCFDAYTSGLGTTFTLKDMGDLTKWFSLEGVTPNVAGVETESQRMFFIPNPQNRLTGGYAFIDTAWAAAAPGVRCTAYISGLYDVVFYPDEEHVVEGDLLLKGTGFNVCPRYVIPIDYSAASGFRIGFRPRPTTP